MGIFEQCVVFSHKIDEVWVILTETNTRLRCRDKQMLIALLCGVEPGKTSRPELRGNSRCRSEGLHVVAFVIVLALELVCSCSRSCLHRKLELSHSFGT